MTPDWLETSKAVLVSPKSQSIMRVIATPDVESELAEYFSYKAQGFWHHPLFKSGVWDGTVHLFHRGNKQMYRGLLSHVAKFCADREYDFKLLGDEWIETKLATVTSSDVQTFLSQFALPFEAHSHQLDAIAVARSVGRCVLLSPTSSGKSLMIYVLARWHLMATQSFVGKALIIVPNVGLIHQLYNNFGKFSAADHSFVVERDCHRIFTGQTKDAQAPIYLSTWQSLQKLPAAWFAKFGAVIVDECHGAAANQLKASVEKCVNAHCRIGTSGSLSDSKVDKMMLEGLFGPIHQITTTAALMTKGLVAKLRIKVVVLKYCDAERKLMRQMHYKDEVKWLALHAPRNRFIAKLVAKLRGNTLVLVNFVKKTKHGQLLVQLIEHELAGSGRKVFFISGATEGEAREQIRQLLDREVDAVAVASYGVFSTGIDSPNLENVIFAHPSKSRIRVLQSIGRGLRIGRSSSATLFDIVDDLSWKSHKNYALQHFLHRTRIYDSERFYYQVFATQLKADSQGGANGHTNQASLPFE